MSYDIVVYANDLNQIALGSLKEQEQNLFFSIIVKLKDRGHEPVSFSATDLINMCGKKYTLSQITEQVKALKEHFFKLDFTAIKALNNGMSELDTINLFKRMIIVLDQEKNINTLTIEVNESFEYLLNQLKVNFTAFELANFLVLNSKYSKTLFRLLKQFRSTGYARFEWNEFKRLMGVPTAKAYTAYFIDKEIIRPAVKELNWNDGQPDIFVDYRGAERPAFKNLTYKKIKKNPSKKTSPVTGIEFQWDLEKSVKAADHPPLAEGHKIDENGKLVLDYKFMR